MLLKTCLLTRFWVWKNFNLRILEEFFKEVKNRDENSKCILYIRVSKAQLKEIILHMKLLQYLVQYFKVIFDQRHFSEELRKRTVIR